MRNYTRIFLMAGLLVPSIALAATFTVTQFVNRVINIITDALVPLVFALAFIVFIWGIFKFFIVGADSEEERENGKKLMVYGLTGFFVMVSVWGLVNILVRSFNLYDRQPDIPTLNINLRT